MFLENDIQFGKNEVEKLTAASEENILLKAKLAEYTNNVAKSSASISKEVNYFDSKIIVWIF